MKKNIAAVKAAGADTVVASCPACDMMWRNVYPEWAAKLGPVGGFLFAVMKPVFPILFPKLLPELMPKVMDNLMAHMLPDVVPLAVPKMIAYLRGRA
jgi:Fe-S oxidoreductase